VAAKRSRHLWSIRPSQLPPYTRHVACFPMKQPGSWYLRAVQVLNEMLNVVDPVSQFHKKGNIAPIKQTVQKDKLQLPRDSSVLSQFLDRVEMFFFHAVFLPATTKIAKVQKPRSRNSYRACENIDKTSRVDRVIRKRRRESSGGHEDMHPSVHAPSLSRLKSSNGSANLDAKRRKRSPKWVSNLMIIWGRDLSGV